MSALNVFKFSFSFGIYLIDFGFIIEFVTNSQTISAKAERKPRKKNSVFDIQEFIYYFLKFGICLNAA